MSKSFPKPTTAGRTSSASQLANNGLVKIENDDGRLRLRFSYGDKRYAMAIGLPDSAINDSSLRKRHPKLS
ncbi:MAG: hypothetical protein HC800_01505 [Phormidesmis sp. RL_2_1]|nr:hypothetical protein [Phormidesmis sp. RL_2_1]